MRFKGNDKKERNSSANLWSDWRLGCGSQPYLRDFAERWTHHMETQLQLGAQVRHIAGGAMRQVREEGAGSLSLDRAQVREVILILRSVWYCGNALSEWGRNHGFLNSDD